ncbi:MAG: tryptophan--tRNA ligase [Candidatus Aenigmarchaeota archaeon]|nr:tryptophan--tRNA ligase [Candidatus Aenigmarchaeota archaeon]MDW8149799.1 tryptophan--tRNA ligase [Candidatus Aenigmarchaeota archaeon]
MEITPWEVKGEVNYEKLIKEFGLKIIDNEILKSFEKKVKNLHFLLKRKIFFAHRDLDVCLNNDFYLYTGRGPSGPMHIGHIIPFYFTKWLQEEFKTNVYIEITDDEKFLVKTNSYEEIKNFANENILDIAAIGFDRNRTFIFRDTEYIKNIYPLALKIAKKINFNTIKAVFGLKSSNNIGIIFFPSIQMVPCFFEKRYCLIPAAVDQDPYWRLQRDIAEKLGYKKSCQIHGKFLPPLIGLKGKMSTSLPTTAIFLNEDEKSIRNKIYKHAFSGGQPSVELHRKLGGNPDVDVSFQWLYFFFEEDDNKLKKIEEDYRSGKLLTGELKDILIEKIVKFLEKFREERDKAKNYVDDYLYNGKLAQLMWETIFE